MVAPVKLKIDEIFAFVAEDDDGEGITGFLGPDGTWLPMVGADMARVDQLRPIAREIARKSGKRIHLLKFSTRSEVEIIEPDEGGK